jgi:hypothetical protein
MRQFYERNVDWKRRCAMVYEQQREQLKQGETEGCTFAPAINRKSDKMAQVRRAECVAWITQLESTVTAEYCAAVALGLVFLWSPPLSSVTAP